MGFKKILSEIVGSDNVPASYQRVGKIILVKLKRGMNSKKIGDAILKIFPTVDSVFAQGAISSKLRKPNVKWIAGKRESETLVKENDCLFKIDVRKVMFSKGNQEEKRRIIKQIKEGEEILDMFAGIGYFTIPIAKLSKAKKITAIDLNPDSIKLLKENIILNKIEDKVKIIKGNSKKICPKLNKKFNRILMGYFPGTFDFLPAAFSCSKPGTLIHFHEVNDNKKNIVGELRKQAEKLNVKIKIISTHKVKKYAPRKYHFVIDFKVIIKPKTL